MSSTKVETLKVPGATLHCEVGGSGPVLLMIPGAPADAAIFAGLREQLADRYTVVTYDLRGLSRSRLDGPAEEQRMEVLGDDAHRVLAAFANEPAYVLACSGGAMAGFELVAQHPEQVRTLVAHEPPLMEMLPDGPQWRQFYQELYDTYQAAGAGAAMGRFFAMVEGKDGPGADHSAEPSGPPPMPDPSQMTPEMLEMMGRLQANIDFFFKHQLRPATSYVPDVPVLQKAPTRVVVGGGAASKGQPAHNAAAALASKLGTDLIEFPGDHQGFASHSEEFASTLDKTLQSD